MNRATSILFFSAIICSTTLSLAQTTRPGDSPATQPGAIAPADQVLDQMLGNENRRAPAQGGSSTGGTPRPLRPIDAPPAMDRTSGEGAMAPGARSVQLLREGTFLIDRVGRLTRTADGNGLEFTFDSDGRAMGDPPVIILPNLKLMAMESAVKSSSRDLRFRITGTVTEYAGRNYVLLEKVVVVPDAGQ